MIEPQSHKLPGNGEARNERGMRALPQQGPWPWAEPAEAKSSLAFRCTKQRQICPLIII